MSRLLVILVALALAIPAGAEAAKVWRAYGIFDGRVEVENGSGTHAARLTQILLPSTFAVKRRGNYLAFGPVGACRSTGSIRIALVESSAARADEVLDEQLPDGRSYGSGTNGDAVWGIVNGGGGKLRGAYIRATRFKDTWVVVRAATTPHRSCHTGGYRESVAYPLADALAATKASGY
jgi:hypothetical protein